MATNKKTAKPAVKKAAKKPIAHKAVKKSTPNSNTKKTVSKPAGKKPAAKPVVKKLVTKSKTVTKKSSTPIKKNAPVKKTAKPVAKKAAPQKLPTQKKSAPTGDNNKIAKSAPKQHVPVKSAEVRNEPKRTESKIPVIKELPKAKDIKVPPPKPVVLPKITTTKSRKYEPDFTKSVLDQAPQENNGPTQRYSDQELNEFRELIQRKLETAKKELGYLQGLITRKDEMGGDDTDNRYMTMEDGSLSMEREQLSQMASRQITFIDHLEKAMMRIENKTYGICRVTGKLIDKARLRAVPHATLSIEAKMGIAK
jgi:RNA polymerase-binding transcription factor DksA